MTDKTIAAALRAGTPGAGTELPPNARPEHDAGMKPPSVDDGQRTPPKASRQLEKKD
ncbi:MAG: hypothetical protein WBA62_21935 [Xanthobacteraceae bacterium]